MTTRILFVDDDPNILAGLRRMLRRQRQEWDMSFVNGGAEALELMSQISFDVLVTDMRMPGIDGAELLKRVASQYPRTIRFMLSGQSEQERILRAIGPVHQFLSKPCPPDTLIQTIRRACDLHGRLQDASLHELISRVGSLPSLPEVYSELVRELKSDHASIDRVADLIRSDVAMTAKVMQLINSSFFGLPQPVTCPRHAVALLGLNIIQPLVLTANVFSKCDIPLIEGFSLEDAIEHSLAVATVARTIAESESQDPQILDDAFIAGMMHDIGKLILAANLTEPFAQALRDSRENGSSLWQAEKELFGVTHAEVGAHLLDLWGLPNPIIEAVAFHHRPAESGNNGFSPLTAVHAANVLRHERSLGTPSIRWDDEYLNALGLRLRRDHWTHLAQLETSL